MRSATDDVWITYSPADDDVWTTCRWQADDVQHDVRMTPGVVLHEIGQLRQVFAWVLAINLTSNNRTSGKSDKKKPSWTALHKADWLTCLVILGEFSVFFPLKKN